MGGASYAGCIARRRVQFEPTPNPHALRATVRPALEPRADLGARSFRTLAAAEHDALAHKLMSVPGVTGVLFSPDGSWLSVNKSAEAEWKVVSVGVRRVLEGEA